MTGAKQLFGFQEIDAEIDVRKRRLVKISEELGGDPELVAARAAFAKAEKAIGALQAKQKDLELEAQTAANRVETLEGRMMRNEVTNPRDLEAVQRELVNLRRRQSDLEEEVLGGMSKIDDVKPMVQTREEAMRNLEQRWASSEEGLIEEQSRIEAELPDLESQREASFDNLTPQAKLLYERIRVKKHGRAVAKVERGMCSGCRITLPIVLVQRARTGKSLVTCSSCGRILYAA